MSPDITQATEKTPTDSPETTGGGRIYRPLTDIVETDQGVSMMLEMPGVAPDAVEITLENRVLTIRGKVDPVRPENLELAYAEYGEGDFERAFTLSEDFDPDRIEAEMRGGVLTLTLPRAPEAQPKRIAVKGA
ncbi:Hsp20/alpha crystallin family protein [Chelatococcus daeguensis]|jgi:HSP20 family protein|uniref:Hsp20/alpha crystallin family protein n=1 Tax=Halodurantibacterium flavum TaxID=1382802 RepID=A0ABW4SAM3_9RHOB|nr:Hsp20/alpha crystallin family protein [Chelatococcus daeguensis]KZE33172.1 heat-shock protein Hsp20 [Chelatococcus daeguensis]MBM3082683.1 Hsp20/alpha crystallin family protein [Chelatococcus daeguensis]